MNASRTISNPPASTSNANQTTASSTHAHDERMPNLGSTLASTTTPTDPPLPVAGLVKLQLWKHASLSKRFRQLEQDANDMIHAMVCMSEFPLLSTCPGSPSGVLLRPNAPQVPEETDAAANRRSSADSASCFPLPTDPQEGHRGQESGTQSTMQPCPLCILLPCTTANHASHVLPTTRYM